MRCEGDGAMVLHIVHVSLWLLGSEFLTTDTDSSPRQWFILFFCSIFESTMFFFGFMNPRSVLNLSKSLRDCIWNSRTVPQSHISQEVSIFFFIFFFSFDLDFVESFFDLDSFLDLFAAFDLVFWHRSYQSRSMCLLQLLALFLIFSSDLVYSFFTSRDWTSPRWLRFKSRGTFRMCCPVICVSSFIQFHCCSSDASCKQSLIVYGDGKQTRSF